MAKAGLELLVILLPQKPYFCISLFNVKFLLSFDVWLGVAWLLLRIHLTFLRIKVLPSSVNVRHFKDVRVSWTAPGSVPLESCGAEHSKQGAPASCCWPVLVLSCGFCGTVVSGVSGNYQLRWLKAWE